MPDGVFMVNMASVLAGFEDLPPPVLVNDEETPKRIGACKSWYDIKGQKVVVGKATIVKPKDRMFHNR